MKVVGTLPLWTLLLVAPMLANADPSRTYHVDPVRGSDTGDGSAERPLKTLAEAVNGGLTARLRGGDVVWLYSGEHGRVVLEGEFADPVRIEAAPKASPKLARLEIARGTNLTVKGVVISPAFDREGGYAGAIVVLGEQGESANLRLEDAFVYTTLDASAWTAEQWKQANSGVTLGRHGTRLAVRNCHVLNTRFGINLCSSESVCEGNLVDGFSGDGVRVTRDGLTLRRNVIKNNYCSAADGDANHDDAIQCFLFNVGTGTVRRATIEQNVIINREDDAQTFPNGLQAIGCFDGPLVDFVVSGNVILVSHWHGVSLFDAQNCRILNNVCFSRWDDKPKPWVQLGSKNGQAHGNVVEGNYAHTFDFKSDAAVRERDNRAVNAKIFDEAYLSLSSGSTGGMPDRTVGRDRHGCLSRMCATQSVNDEPDVEGDHCACPTRTRSWMPDRKAAI